MTEVNEDTFLPESRYVRKLNYEAGGLLLAERVRKGLLANLDGRTFDAVWVDSGRNVGPKLVREMRERWGPVINYNPDDPFGYRDRLAWLLYRKAVPEYSLMVVVRTPNVEEAKVLGARRVERIYRLADEVAHAPRMVDPERARTFDADVAFTGTCFEDRGAFMASLVERGLPLSLRGNRWDRTPQWSILQRAWKGPGTTNDEDYAAAILCAKINMGLLSQANRDEHTSRSAEIPYMGGLFCAPRTPEHLGMYRDGEEAVFWDDADECLAVCTALLKEPERMREIAANGRKRALANGYVNEPVLARLLETAS